MVIGWVVIVYVVVVVVYVVVVVVYVVVVVAVVIVVVVVVVSKFVNHLTSFTSASASHFAVSNELFQKGIDLILLSQQECEHNLVCTPLCTYINVRGHEYLFLWQSD